MKDVLTFLQNADAIAFAVLGVVTALVWAKRRDRSLGFLALAIVLLSLVSLLGRVPAAFTPPLLPQLSLVAFVGSGYALVRFRGSLIPISPRWHAAAATVLVVTTAAYFVTQGLVALHAAPIGVETGAGLLLIVVWASTVLEPIVRFWLVARDLPAVQAWRLRSLSFGFGGLVAILAFAIGASAFATQPAFQVAVQLAIIAIVPLLYASFSPPSWLRRQWRSAEEEGLRAFMEDLLLLRVDPDTMADRALEWAMRLVGGAAAVALDGRGGRIGSRGLNPDQLRALEQRLPQLSEGVSRVHLGEVDRTVLVLPLASTTAKGRLIVLAGPFTPNFGGEELSRVQQFMTAVAAAVDRARLLGQLQEANADLLLANRHKTVFLANMSHELRTPLNAILGFSELLIDSTKGQFPDATRLRFLEQINTSGKHLLGLINDILDLSKIEAGQMELRLQMVSVEDVLTDVARTVEPLLTKKEIVLELDVARAGHVLVDEGKLRQMVMNLVSNAIKFTPAGGTVKVEAIRLAGRLNVCVSDSGIGIAKQDIHRIFQEFQQVDSGANRKEEGTGLGLALTRRFAILHGGDVHLQTEIGKGSRFTIDLPLEARSPARQPTTTTAGGSESSADLSRALVMIVEDDPASAELLARQIEGAGFRTEIARTGTDAVALAKQHRPAAITLDIMLPDVDGWEVLTRLKSDELTTDIPVIVVSVVDNPGLAQALGALDHLVKPIEAKEITNRLSNFNFNGKGGARQTCILVVDDESANREWLKHVLEPAGFKVTLATGGQEAIDLARSGAPDVVLLDLLMPDVSGFDVVEALQKQESTKAIPIMILTVKHLTEADTDRLHGHVSTILKRDATAASDVLGQLQGVLNKNTGVR